MQKAFQGLPEEGRGREGCTDPKIQTCEQTRVQAKKQSEGWADFVQKLCCLVDKAYPDLETNACEQLALSHYLITRKRGLQ